MKSLIDGGLVRVDGKAAKPSRRLRGGESIELIVPAAAPVEIAPEDLPLEILYEDGDLLVLNKQAGMVVHPGAGHRAGTLVNALLHRVRDLAGIGGRLRPGLVHRLDKDTSGCLVVAKNERALVALQAAFKSRSVRKIYLALVHGQPSERGRLLSPLGRHPVHRQRFTGRLKSGRPAETEFVVCERLDGAALLEVELKTGRTHQIRVHLAEAGYPLLGDPVYGRRRGANERVSSVQRELGRQALHAWKLEVAHPVSGEPLRFEASVPADFQRALQTLRRERILS